MAENAEILYRSAAQTDVQPCSVGRRKFPLAKNAPDYLKAYAFDVEFECLLDGIFPPQPKNTKANAAAFNAVAGYSLVDANAILTDYSQPSDSGAGLGKFTGTFHIVPASWDDFKTMSFTYPGWIGIIGTSTSRDISSYKVTTRLHYDYFLVDPDNLANGVKDSANVNIVRVNSMSLIPSIYKSYFYNTVGGAPAFNSVVNSLVPAGGVAIGSIAYVQTFPTTQNYQAWITAATNNAWTSLVWNGVDLTQDQTKVGQIVADDSWLEPYAGNIIARVTPYILIK